MPHRSNSSSLTIAVGAVLIAAILLSAASSIWMLREQALRDWNTQLSELSLVLAENTSQQFTTASLALDDAVRIVQDLKPASSAQLRQLASTRQVHSMLRKKLEFSPQLDVLTIVDRNGDVVNFTRAYPAGPINLADRHYFQLLAEEGGPQMRLSAPVQNKGNGKWTFYLGRRLLNAQGEFIGAVLAGISVDFYTDYYHRIASQGFMSLYRDDLVLLARWPRRDEALGKTNTVGATRIVLQDRKQDAGVVLTEGPYFTNPQRQGLRMVAVRRVPRFPLVVATGVDEDNLLGEWRKSALVIGGIALVTGLALAWAFLLLSRALTHREADLAATVALKQQAERDNATKTRLLADLAEKQLALEDTSRRMLALVENAADAIIVMSETGVIESFNKAAESIFGYAANEIIGQPISALLRTRRVARDNSLHAFGLAQLPILGMERQGERRDGGAFPIEMSVNEFAISGGRKLIAIVRDITERKKVERMKTEFVSTVSHELRTPLTSIRGTLGLVANGVLGPLPERAQALLKTALTSSEHLTHLINDLLDMQKIESGELRFHMLRLPVQDLLDEAVTLNRAYADRHGQQLALDAPCPQAALEIDRDRFAQVMANLLSNACKYSPQGGTVQLRASQPSPDVVRIEVTDHGPGVPAGFRSRIFKKFSQADSSDTRAKEGTGLGLAITRALVRKMGGNIGFDSTPNVRTCFYVEFPAYALVQPLPATV